MKPTNSSWANLRHHPLFWPVVALLLIMLFNAVFMPSFFKLEIKDGHLFGSLVDVLNRGAPLMLLAIGMTMVIATAGVDLSVGAIIAITAASAAVLINPALGRELVTSDKLIENVTQTPLWLVIIISMGAATLCGIWNGLLVSRARIQPMVATLVLMVAGRGIAQLITNGQIITIYYSPYFYFGGGYFLGLPFPLFIVVAVFLIAWFLSRKTAIGLFVEAVGTNASSSFYSGINEKNIKLLAYTFCGFCAGIAGLIISSNVKSADANNAGLWSELDAILAVVIGGTLMSGGRFSLVGSLLGALIIQSMTTTIYAFGVPPEVVLVVKALVVLAVVLLYSDLVKTSADKLFDRKVVQQ